MTLFILQRPPFLHWNSAARDIQTIRNLWPDPDIRLAPVENSLDITRHDIVGFVVATW